MTKQEKDLRARLGDEAYDQMKSHLYSKSSILGEGSPFSSFLQEMVNAMLSGELEGHLDEEKAKGEKNKRNGKLKKTVMSSVGALEIETPRDRNGSFEPQLIEKRQRSLSSGLDQQILALYGQGNSIEDVRRLLHEIYGVSISSGRISQITDSILPKIEEWRNRELKPFYTVLYLDAMYFKVRKDGRYSTSAFFTVYAVDWHGQRDLLGLYTHDAEGASRWSLILEDLKRRGLQDVIVVCTDDLKGFSEAIGDIYPKAVVQKCIVHQMRNSLRYVDDKDRKEVVKALRSIYTSLSIEDAKVALDAFDVTWGHKYKHITKLWTEKWEELMAYMSNPLAIRKMIYTTNPVEAVHRVVRKLIKSKAAWVSETALLKQIYLSLMQNTKSWQRKARKWTEIQRELIAMYPDRVPQSP